MKTITSPIERKTTEVKDYISVIRNAVELFELYSANIQLEILKGNLRKKLGSSNDDEIMAEITLACKLQDVCKHLV